MAETNDKSAAELARILESARRLGVEVNEADALQWLTNMASAADGNSITVDARTGVFGHNITMLDFSQQELEYFRRIGRLVEFADVPGVVETALALSGSAAQSKIQSYPGDCDYFERINILAPSREEACQILAKIMREKALNTLQGPTYQLIEVKYGSYPQDMVIGDRQVQSRHAYGLETGSDPGGKNRWLPAGWHPVSVAWEAVGTRPDGANWIGWWLTRSASSCRTPVTCWMLPGKNRMARSSLSMAILIHISRRSIWRLLRCRSSPNLLSMSLPMPWIIYVEQLEHEVQKYLTKDINYGKVAKRMYNIFRLTGRYEEAAFLRELFDEPATILYQVWSLIRTIDDAYSAGSSIPPEESDRRRRPPDHGCDQGAGRRTGEPDCEPPAQAARRAFAP